LSIVSETFSTPPETAQSISFAMIPRAAKARALRPEEHLRSIEKPLVVSGRTEP